MRDCRVAVSATGKQLFRRIHVGSAHLRAHQGHAPINGTGAAKLEADLR